MFASSAKHSEGKIREKSKYIYVSPAILCYVTTLYVLYYKNDQTLSERPLKHRALFIWVLIDATEFFREVNYSMSFPLIVNLIQACIHQLLMLNTDEE